MGKVVPIKKIHACWCNGLTTIQVAQMALVLADKDPILFIQLTEDERDDLECVILAYHIACRFVLLGITL